MKTFGFLAASLVFSSVVTTQALAADVFVKQARGSDLSRQQVAEITGLVRNAVTSMPEHQLVNSQTDADFVLQPSVLARGDEMILRIEKMKGSEVLAMSEEKINSFDSSRNRAIAVTETALQDDGYTDYSMDDGGTSSAASSSASDSELYSNNESLNGAQTGYTPSAGGGSPSVGELTAASPRLANPDRAGQIQLGVGPSFGIGMSNNNVMYDVLIAYAVDLSDNFVAKGFGDLNFGTGSEASRFMNFGIAGEWYPTRELLTFGKPYLGADVGYAFTRNTFNQQSDNLALGAAAGFKFQAADLNWDVNAHYTVLMDDIDGATPSVLGVRLALGF